MESGATEMMVHGKEPGFGEPEIPWPCDFETSSFSPDLPPSDYCLTMTMYVNLFAARAQADR